MQGLRLGFSCLTLLAGFAVASIPAVENASAAPAMADVCAIKKDGPKWYPSASMAKKDGASIMHPGDCQQVVCAGMAPKVALYLGVVASQSICGRDPLTHAKMTYPNTCAIEYAGAAWIHAGPCK
jgi:hypothetical protein